MLLLGEDNSLRDRASNIEDSLHAEELKIVRLLHNQVSSPKLEKVKVGPESRVAPGK